MSLFESSSLSRVFMLINLFFGSYFDITSSKVLSVVVRLFCLLGTMLSIGRMCFYPNEYSKKTVYMTVLEAALTSLASQIHAQKYIFSFINTMKTCDKLMGYKRKYPLRKSVAYMLIVLLTIFVRVFNAIQAMIILKSFRNFPLVSLSFLYAVICIDINSFKATCVICLLYNRLKSLRKILAGNRISVNIVGRHEISRNLKVVRMSVMNYYRILDGFDNINVKMQMTLISIIIFIVPRLSENAYFHSKVIFSATKVSPLFFFNITDTCMVLAWIFGPSVAAELCVSEVDAIKTLLTQQIIKCSDMALLSELQWALDCVSRRPFHFTILHVIPVNITLPVAVCTVCVTYTILSLQFLRFAIV